MFFSTASEAKREVKSFQSIKTSMNSENSGHLWHKMSQIYLKNSLGHLQISSYFWVFWGKIQLSSAQHVSWFGFGGKIFPGNSLPHMGLSSMPFWSKYTNPPTFMICGINFFKMLSITWSIFQFFADFKKLGFKRIYQVNLLPQTAQRCFHYGQDVRRQIDVKHEVFLKTFFQFRVNYSKRISNINAKD